MLKRSYHIDTISKEDVQFGDIEVILIDMILYRICKMGIMIVGGYINTQFM